MQTLITEIYIRMNKTAPPFMNSSFVAQKTAAMLIWVKNS